MCGVDSITCREGPARSFELQNGFGLSVVEQSRTHYRVLKVIRLQVNGWLGSNGSFLEISNLRRTSQGGLTLTRGLNPTRHGYRRWVSPHAIVIFCDV